MNDTTLWKLATLARWGLIAVAAGVVSFLVVGVGWVWCVFLMGPQA